MLYQGVNEISTGFGVMTIISIFIIIPFVLRALRAFFYNVGTTKDVYAVFIGVYVYCFTNIDTHKE